MAQQTLILGLGLSGIAAARHAIAAGDDVTIYGGSLNDGTLAAAQEFIDQGVPVYFDTEDVQGRYQLCVVCPGIPEVSAFYKSAKVASAKLVSEPEYAWSFSPEGWIAVTGTNGKTTTAALVAHLVSSCGIDACLCGNTQKTTVTSACEQRQEGSALVAELSSFQLASTLAFAPRVAVLLNITSDHLAWHGGQQAYRDAKLKILANLQAGQCAVITDSVPDMEQEVAHLRGRGVRVVRIGSRRGADCAFAAEGQLVYVDAAGAEHVLAAVEDLKIKGAHNVENALAAACAAIDYGCPVADVASALVRFAPLEHRIEPCGQAGGVSFYNDSKATNVDATLKALQAFGSSPVVVMLGGRDKGTDLAELVATCERTCSAAVCYGEAGERFHEAFAASSCPAVRAQGFDDAFAAACAQAGPGDVVLLSPACASFDEFSGFAQRGDRFKELVRQRRQGS